MTFIGMISDHKSFDKVKEELKEPQLELIHINKKSIENIKNDSVGHYQKLSVS